MPRLVPGRILAIAVLASVVAGGGTARGQTAWYEGFEGPETSWRPESADASYRLDLHQRIRGQAHTGEGCERLKLSAAAGTHVYIGHDVGRPRIISELLATVWVKSDRPGLQILARVILPRSKDARTGKPVSTLLRGSSYTTTGRWEQLRIDDFPRLLTRQARLLRTQPGSGIDAREAYVDGILLNVYGGPGATNVWIDDLDIAGHVGLQPEPTAPSAVAGGSGWSRSGAGPGRVGPSAGSNPPPSDRSDRGHVELVGSVLLVDGRPTLPRMIQYQGEPLAVLKQLGFNTIWLAEPPAVELLDEASRLGLWLVCPPPLPLEPSAADGSPPRQAQIGLEYDRVLAWNLGRGFSQQHLQWVKQAAELVRAADRHKGRPLVCGAHDTLRAFSRHVDLLLIGRSPLGTSLELVDHRRWIHQRSRLARPGTLIWTTVQTQPAQQLQMQLTALGGGKPSQATIASEQIRLLVYTSVVAGSRGLLFESHCRLDAPDPLTRDRAAALELLNLELGLIEPWVAAGSFVATVKGSQPEVLGAVLRTDRARLLVPIWSGAGAQFVPGQSAGNSVSLVVPGVPESNDAYEITPGGLRPVRHKRVTGGMRVTLGEFGVTSLVMLTQDPLVISSLSRRAANVGRRAAVLQRQLAARKLQTVEQVHGRLAGPAASVHQSAEQLIHARRSLQSCDGLLATRDYTAAYLHAQRAMRPLRLLERAAWEAAVDQLDSPVSSPTAVSFATLPRHAELMRRIAGWRPGPNLLVGGDFEDLDAMLRSGWRHFQHATPDLRTEAELVPTIARSGNSCLRLAVRPGQPKDAPSLVETPTVWITSPAVSVEAGGLVRIQGWVQIPAAITGSVDGLIVVDSLAGEVLAERIGQTEGWQRFTLYRIAAESGRVTVTFALSGVGEACLDDVTIRPLAPTPSGVTRLPRPDHPRQ